MSVKNCTEIVKKDNNFIIIKELASCLMNNNFYGDRLNIGSLLDSEIEDFHLFC
jgi:hypothetical protein